MPRFENSFQSTLAVLSLAWLFISADAGFAQGVAPTAFNSEQLTLSINSGSGPFASGGSYLFGTSLAGTDYTALGDSGISPATGSYTYSTTASNAGAVQLSGGTVLQLLYNSGSAGTFVVSNVFGIQSGTFTSTNYASLSPPVLFLCDVTNRQFEGHVGAQNGVNCALDTSSNLANWITFTNLSITNQSAYFRDDTSAGLVRFYRTHVSSASFAPADLAGKSLNCTVSTGTGSMAGSGIYEFAGTNTTGYLIYAGVGTTNSSGSYAYTRTGGQSASLVLTDSLMGTLHEQLWFISPSRGFYYITNTSSGGSQSGSFTFASGVSLFVGNLKSTADPGNTASGYFEADGTPLQLSITNQDGSIWSLTVPGNASGTPMTITLTACTNVSSSECALPVYSTVRLDPDGAQFVQGVTLTLTTQTPLNANASIVLASHDGKDILFVPSTNQANAYSATIYHFSSAGAVNPSGSQWQNFLQQFANQAQDAYNSLVNTVQEYIDSVKYIVPPPPPDYLFTCHPNPSAEAVVHQYVSSAFNDVRQILDKLRSLVTLFQAFTSGAQLMQDQILNAFQDGPITTLVNDYQSPDEFWAVANLYQTATLQAGGPPPPDLVAKIDSWALRTYDSYLSKLRDQHDFTMIKILPKVYNSADSVAPEAITFGEYISDFSKALTFQLTVDIVKTGSSGTEESKGTITLTGNSITALPVSGTGAMNYISGTLPDGGTIVLPQSYSANPVMPYFGVCDAGTMGIVLDRFGANSENWTDHGFPVSIPFFLENVCETAFASEVIESGAYDARYLFTCSFNNFNTRPINQTFTAPVGTSGATVNLTLILDHTPQ